MSLNVCFPLKLALRTTHLKSMYESREVLLYQLRAGVLGRFFEVVRFG